MQALLRELMSSEAAGALYQDTFNIIQTYLFDLLRAKQGEAKQHNILFAP